MIDELISPQAFAAFLIGAAVGTGELVARYRDAPFKAIITGPGIVYVSINAVAGGAAFVLIRAFRWEFGVDPSNPFALVATQILVAGFGAMALFRSSLFTVRVGNSDVAIGPSSFLTIILDAADREVDRARARDRALSVKRIMTGVLYQKARLSLPLACFALLQNVPAEEQQRVQKEISDLDGDTEVPEHTKLVALGLTLMNVVGELALEAAVESLGDEIKTSPDGAGTE